MTETTSLAPSPSRRHAPPAIRARRSSLARLASVVCSRYSTRYPGRRDRACAAVRDRARRLQDAWRIARQPVRPAACLGVAQLLGHPDRRALLAHARQFAADRGSRPSFFTLALASMAAFAFAHLRFFGDRFLLDYLLLGLMFPAATAILPLFIKVRDLGLLERLWGVVLPQAAFALGMGVLLLRNAFKAIAERIARRGADRRLRLFPLFLYVTLPLSRPILATVAIIAFVASWNNYLLPLILLDSDERYPWPLGLMAYQGE